MSSEREIPYSSKHPVVLWLPFCGEIILVDGTVPTVEVLPVGIGRGDLVGLTAMENGRRT